MASKTIKGKGKGLQDKKSNTAASAGQSVRQNLSLPLALFNRALKLERERGIKITHSLRQGLNEFLIKHNY